MEAHVNTVLGRRAGSVDTRARGAVGDIQLAIVGEEGRSWGERGEMLP